MGMVDEAGTDLGLLAGCDLVVLAVPVLVLTAMLKEIAALDPLPGLVSDVGSVKASVMKAAAGQPRLRFIGGHPMAGTERSGLEAADADLFRDALWVLTDSGSPGPEGPALEELVRGLGARPRWMDAVEHDRWVAAVSHSAFVLSSAYTLAVTSDDEWQDNWPLAAGGFRDVTRIASGNPQMYEEICRANAPAILAWLDRLEERLTEFRTRIAAADPGLLELFARARSARNQWLEWREADS